jgi:hypothetical protein
MRKSQTIIEYAVVVSCVIAAFISMTIYMKRGISGNLRKAADDLGQHYEPQHVSGWSFTESTRDSESFSHAVPGFFATEVDEDGYFVIPDDRVMKQMTVEIEQVNQDESEYFSNESVEEYTP